MISGESRLSTREAVDLAHAWVQAFADAQGARVLFLKGPMLHRFGLREERVSTDVDVLVAGDDFAMVCEAFGRAGWSQRGSGRLLSLRSVHSRTFISPGWPCDIDLHLHFPGFFADPRDVFEVLWQHRVEAQFAGRRCSVPDRVCSALILGLNSLRDSESVRQSYEFERLLDAAFTASEAAQMRLVAAQTGSAEALERTGWDLDSGVSSSPVDIDREQLRKWRVRTDMGGNGLGAYLWLGALKSSAPWRWPSLLWALIWPSDEDMRFLKPEVPHDPKGMRAAKIRRLTSAVGAFPQLVASVWRNRKR